MFNALCHYFPYSTTQTTLPLNHFLLLLPYVRLTSKYRTSAQPVWPLPPPQWCIHRFQVPVLQCNLSTIQTSVWLFVQCMKMVTVIWYRLRLHYFVVMFYHLVISENNIKIFIWCPVKLIIKKKQLVATVILCYNLI